MSAVVVDTNVLLVAELMHDAASPECVRECVTRLQGLQRNGQVTIDDGFRALHEYQNKLDARRGKGVGTAFLRWLLQNQANPARVARVPLTETAADEYAEFPGAALQARFDPPDRKFPSISNAHPDKPPIWQAVDCKWLDWWQELAQAGVQVEFLCPNDICNYHRRKFPDKAEPSLP